MAKIKKGVKVTVSGRFIPESKMDDITKGNIDISYPQIDLNGEISLILKDENCCVVDFDERFDMKIPNEDIMFQKKYRYTLEFISEVRDEGINNHKMFSYFMDVFTIKATPRVISTTPNYEKHKNKKGFMAINELPIYEFGGENIAIYEVVSNTYNFVGEVELIDENNKSIILEIKKVGSKYYADFKRFE